MVLTVVLLFKGDKSGRPRSALFIMWRNQTGTDSGKREKGKTESVCLFIMGKSQL